MKNEKPSHIVSSGVRIFPSGRENKDQSTLNATRRKNRLERRQRDRYLQRRKYLLYLLKKHGLLPEDIFSARKLVSLNPYKLRAEGLDGKLDLHHFGRAIFHLNQRRGFKSNRKSGDAKEGGIINKTIKQSSDSMEKGNYRTYGEFLWHRFQKMDSSRRKSGSQEGNWVLARKSIGGAKNDNYVVYASRKMIEEEFDRLWDSQARFHEQLNKVVKNKRQGNQKLKNIFFQAIFYQRKLKQPIIGQCSLIPAEKRVARVLPSFQRFRILKELNNLSYVDKFGHSFFIKEMDRGLEFRDQMIEKLFLKQEKVTFKRLEKEFKLFFKNVKYFSCFNLNTFSRNYLYGDQTNSILKKTIAHWSQWELKRQDSFIEVLEGENKEEEYVKDDEEVLKDLEQFNEKNNLGLSSEILENCVNETHKLVSGHGQYSKKAIQKILPFLEKGQLEYDAIKSAKFPSCSSSSAIKTQRSSLKRLQRLYHLGNCSAIKTKTPFGQH